MAVPTLVGSNSSGSGVAVTPTLVTGTTTGDVCVLFIESHGTESTPTISGGSGWSAWTLISSTVTVGSRFTWYWARATSASPTMPTVADMGDHNTVAQVVYRGCKATGNPWDVAPLVTTTADTTNAVNIPNVTTTTADNVVISGVATGTDALTAGMVSGWTNAGLSGIAEVFDRWVNSGGGGGLAAAAGGKAVAGAVGNTTATASASMTGDKCYFSIALAPVADISQALGVASGTHTAGPISVAQDRTVPATPTGDVSTAGPVRADLETPLGAAQETDTAGPVTEGAAPQNVAVAPATETDTARPARADLDRAAGPATETDSATAARVDQERSTGAAQETDTALPARADVARAAGPAAETDTAPAVRADLSAQSGTATETDTAQGVRIDQARAAGPAGETDTAQPATSTVDTPLAPAQETSSAQPVVVDQSRTPTPASETDAAGPVTSTIETPLAPASETSTAGPVEPVVGGAPGSSTPVSPAQETDTAHPVRADTTTPLDPAAESDTARPVTVVGDQAVEVGPAAETDTARGATPTVPAEPGTGEPIVARDVFTSHNAVRSPLVPFPDYAEDLSDEDYSKLVTAMAMHQRQKRIDTWRL